MYYPTNSVTVAASGVDHLQLLSFGGISDKSGRRLSTTKENSNNMVILKATASKAQQPIAKHSARNGVVSSQDTRGTGSNFFNSKLEPNLQYNERKEKNRECLGAFRRTEIPADASKLWFAMGANASLMIKLPRKNAVQQIENEQAKIIKLIDNVRS